MLPPPATAVVDMTGTLIFGNVAAIFDVVTFIADVFLSVLVEVELDAAAALA